MGATTAVNAAIGGRDLECGSDVSRSQITTASDSTAIHSALVGIELRTIDDASANKHLTSKAVRRKSMLYQPLGMVAETAADVVEKEVLNVTADPTPKAKSVRVLIVDDTTTTRKITSKLLTNLGYEVDEAPDGLVFLRKIGLRANGERLSTPVHEKQFDVVLMDDNMPNMCGPDATALARSAGYAGVIFGVTGNIAQADVDNFISKGANCVFTKPLDMQKLQASVEERVF